MCCYAFFLFPFLSLPRSPTNWKTLLAKVRPDVSPMPKRYYRPAMATLGSMTMGVAWAIGGKFSALMKFFAEAKRLNAMA